MNVFVLGAGASAPAGFPLGRDLMEVAREWIPYEEAYVPLLNELERLRIFRAEDDFELNLTRLDLEIIGGHRRGKPATVTIPGHAPCLLTTFREWGLSEAIRAPLETKLDETLKTPARMNYLRGFVKKHVRPGDRVITFNYDCLLEAVLRGEGLWTLGDGYGVDLRPIYPDLQNEGESPCTVLKLHGSAGWFFAVMNNRLLIDLASSSRLIGYSELKRTSLPRDEGVTSGAILPSFVKGFSRYPMPVIWRKAAEAVSQADCIAFIGYSFPPADSVARMLFLTSARPTARLAYFWYEDSDLPRVRELVDQFKGAGLSLSDVKSCIEHMRDVETLWPERFGDLYCGHRTHGLAKHAGTPTPEA